LSKASVRALVRETEFLNAKQDYFFADTPKRSYTIRTQLDMVLQNELIAILSRLRTLDRGKPRRIAMVAMDGSTGFIKAMAGFDLAAPGSNPCIASDYPAASIFKIVTAAGAVDTLGYAPHTPLFFNGQKYTLYKRQLKETRNKYTSRVTLARAFADSINPVFGKIGMNDLGRKKLNTYAHAFGFNQDPDTDFDFSSGRFAVTESDYHLAELGCGFNRQTQISPIFGAILVSSILNKGHSLIPRMVDKIEITDGSQVYNSKKEIYKSPIRPQTARAMIQLMEKTVSSGTAKKAFRGYSRDKVLSQLVIGGKTGSLYNTARTIKYDWFVGFGKKKNSSQSLVVSVVVGHGKYIGTRASTHARTMIKTHFKPRTALKKEKS